MSSFLEKLKILVNTRRQNAALHLADICLFLQQFSTLIATDIPLIQTCELLEKSQEKSALNLLIYRIKRDLLSGRSLSQSLQLHPQYFNELTCQLIEIGEQTGKLEQMFEAVTQYHEKNMALKKKLQLLLFYPALISGVAFIVVFILLMFIIPQFAALFQENTSSLPLFTRMIFFLSLSVAAHPLLATIFSVMIFLVPIYFFQNMMRVSSKQPRLLTILQRIPLWERFFKKIILSRFSRNLALTFSAGLAIHHALLLAAKASPETNFTQLVALLRSRISSGMALHQAMATESHYFSLIMV